MAEVRSSSGVPTLDAFGGIGSPSPCAPLVVDTATGFIYAWMTGDVIVPAGTGGMVPNGVPAGATLTVPAGYSMVTTGPYVVLGAMTVLGDWIII